MSSLHEVIEEISKFYNKMWLCSFIVLKLVKRNV